MTRTRDDLRKMILNFLSTTDLNCKVKTIITRFKKVNKINNLSENDYWFVVDIILSVKGGN